MPIDCFLHLSVWEYFALSRPVMLCESLVELKSYVKKVSEDCGQLEKDVSRTRSQQLVPFFANFWLGGFPYNGLQKKGCPYSNLSTGGCRKGCWGEVACLVERWGGMQLCVGCLLRKERSWRTPKYYREEGCGIEWEASGKSMKGCFR